MLKKLINLFKRKPKPEREYINPVLVNRRVDAGRTFQSVPASSARDFDLNERLTPMYVSDANDWLKTRQSEFDTPSYDSGSSSDGGSSSCDSGSCSCD